MKQVPADILEAAKQAYELEVSSEYGHEEALRSAIMAALWKYKLQVVNELADYAAAMAVELDEPDSDYSLAVDGPAAILWFVMEVKNTIPPTEDL